MEDEAAEIELLEQNLNKTHQISQRMVSILTSFDTRLVKLEKSILPLHSSTQLLYRRAANIEKTLGLIDEVASSQQGLADEEALILRGPQVPQLAAYLDAMERLNANIAFKGNSSESADTARLVETGARKLAQLYTKLVAEASSGSPPVRSSLDMQSNRIVVPFPEDIVQDLRPLVTFLRTLPIPSTHPTHLAAPSIQSALNEAQRGYADMRGTWIKKCLEDEAKRIVEGMGEGFGSGRDTNPAESGYKEGQEFGMWIESILDVAENEYAILYDLALLPTAKELAGTFASLLTPLLTMLSTSITQLTNRVKRALQANTFLALSAHSYLASTAMTQRWDEVIRRRANGSTANVNALKEGLHSLRAVCLRSFPEFLVDIKQAAIPRGEIGTDVADITYTVRVIRDGWLGKALYRPPLNLLPSPTVGDVPDFSQPPAVFIRSTLILGNTQVIRYMVAIPPVQEAVGSALLTLGDGNWKMGEGVQVAKGPKLGEGYENTIIEHFFYDIVKTTITTLTTLSKAEKRASIGSVFLLNNLTYLQTALLFSSDSTTPVETFIALPARNALQSAFRTAKAGYFDANFSPLLQVLGDGPSSSASNKMSVKEKFTRFYDLLDELAERHKLVRVLPDDARNRDALGDEAVKLVVPSLQRFIQKNKDFSKNPQKYIRSPPEEVEKIIKKFY